MLDGALTRKRGRVKLITGEVPHPAKTRVLMRKARVTFRSPLKRRFSPARRREAQRTGRTPKVRTARKPPENAAGEVPQPTKKRVLMRKARGCDVRGAGLWPTGRT